MTVPMHTAPVNARKAQVALPITQPVIHQSAGGQCACTLKRFRLGQRPLHSSHS